jgi:hypothetical protein
MKTIFIYLIPLSVLSQENLVLSGFIDGVQKDISHPSTCYSNLKEIPAQVQTLGSSTGLSDFLHKFQSLVNYLALTVQICSFQPLCDKIASLLIPANMDAESMYVLENLNSFLPLYESYLNSESTGDLYYEGWYLGKIFSLLFNYYL